MDPDRQILLVHFDFEGPTVRNGLWACPGGGVDPGETNADALRRELREELGLEIEVADVGSPIWLKEHEFEMAGWDGQADTFYLVEVPAFKPTPQFSEAELRAEGLDDMRWWTWEKLQEAERVQASGEDTHPNFVTLSPRPLVQLLRDLMTQGRPRLPLRLGPL